ncbi:MAG TPA: hypothetical protein H9715_06870 [Candidatus Merdibacter merdigallinarum]|nr:hypothetical protein [Candidatus Merdibacter merdigallinarum]
MALLTGCDLDWLEELLGSGRSRDANAESGAFSGLSDITIRMSPVEGEILENASILGGATGVTLDLSRCFGPSIGQRR